VATVQEIANVIATTLPDGPGRELTRLAAQEAALRWVATLVARGVPPNDVFTAVAREVGLLLGVDSAYLARNDADGTAMGVATWSPGDEEIPVARLAEEQAALRGWRRWWPKARRRPRCSTRWRPRSSACWTPKGSGSATTSPAAS
jgi:hypothetical protein